MRPALFQRSHFPALAGATEWLNSEPLGPAALRDGVVLVDFWTLTCINWLRTAPYVRAWAGAYREDGLVVIGVHTPEFLFERDRVGVRRAVADRRIDYPVAVDNDYAIWSGFDNHYWPARYLVDGDGAIRDTQFGEGRYEHSERVIQHLLGIERGLVADAVEGRGVEAPADSRRLRSPETYLGYDRGERFPTPSGVGFDQRRWYEPPLLLHINHWALAGEWTIGPEYVALEDAGGSLSFHFHARDVHLVLARGTPEPIPFRVSLDGAPPGRAHGGDVDEEGNGRLSDGRLYQLVRQDGDVGRRIVKITFLAAGARAYAFTFG